MFGLEKFDDNEGCYYAEWEEGKKMRRCDREKRCIDSEIIHNHNSPNFICVFANTPDKVCPFAKRAFAKLPKLSQFFGK